MMPFPLRSRGARVPTRCEHVAAERPCGGSELTLLESLLCAGRFVSLTEQGEEIGQRW